MRGEYGSSFVYSEKSAALYEYTGQDVKNSASAAGKKGDFKWAKWGTDDKLPNKILEVIGNNHQAPTLIAKRRDIVYGSGPQLFRKVVLDGKESIEVASEPAIEEWMKLIQVRKYLRAAAYQYSYFHNVFTTLAMNTLGTQVVTLNVRDCTEVRAEIESLESGQIENYLLCGNWSKAGTKDFPILKVPAYSEGIEVQEPVFMVHSQDEVPGQRYYSWAPYWGGLNWTEISNLIPEWHIAGLQNGYNVKYHVKMPRRYFEELAGSSDETELKKYREEWQSKMDDYLAGKNNVNKTLISEFLTDEHSGKAYPGFEIIPIGGDNPHEQYIRLAEMANQSLASAHGIHPSLAGVDTGGKLGGSGSELRSAYQLQQLGAVIAREIILEPVSIAYKLSGFPPEFFIGFQDIDLTTLDKNPTGKQTVTAGTSGNA